ncbi:unnamed protein product [Lactuca virosa]|uniref:NADP-dependent oxidoreductase domain-containing protein n=1 Tax=Lactuca virosa TaxID=75947 RepID=A0AAU9NUM8_9ASTR|nr:unnamed protein product [Lactuca virosa]
MCSSADNRILPKLEFNWRIVMATIIGFLGSVAALSKCTLSLPHYQLGSSPSQEIRSSTLFDLSISTVFKQVEGIEEIYESFKLCLGTMTFGEQNSLSQSFKLLDKAFDSGINFFDSAEM